MILPCLLALAFITVILLAEASVRRLEARALDEDRWREEER